MTLCLSFYSRCLIRSSIRLSTNLSYSYSHLVVTRRILGSIIPLEKIELSDAIGVVFSAVAFGTTMPLHKADVAAVLEWMFPIPDYTMQSEANVASQ